MHIAGLYIPKISDNTLDTFTMANPLRICKKCIGPCVISGFRREVFENCFLEVFRISGRNVE
jgi:hypothetical protein